MSALLPLYRILILASKRIRNDRSSITHRRDNLLGSVSVCAKLMAARERSASSDPFILFLWRFYIK